MLLDVVAWFCLMRLRLGSAHSLGFGPRPQLLWARGSMRIHWALRFHFGFCRCRVHCERGARSVVPILGTTFCTQTFAVTMLRRVCALAAKSHG